MFTNKHKLLTLSTAVAFALGTAATGVMAADVEDRPSGTNLRGEEVEKPMTGGEYDKQEAADRPSGTNIRGEDVKQPPKDGEYDEMQNAPDRPSGQNVPSR